MLIVISYKKLFAFWILPIAIKFELGFQKSVTLFWANFLCRSLLLSRLWLTGFKLKLRSISLGVFHKRDNEHSGTLFFVNCFLNYFWFFSSSAYPKIIARRSPKPIPSISQDHTPVFKNTLLRAVFFLSHHSTLPLFVFLNAVFFLLSHEVFFSPRNFRRHFFPTHDSPCQPDLAGLDWV